MATRRTSSFVTEEGSPPAAPFMRSSIAENPGHRSSSTTTTKSSVLRNYSPTAKSVIGTQPHRRKKSARRISSDEFSFEDFEKSAIEEADRAALRRQVTHDKPKSFNTQSDDSASTWDSVSKDEIISSRHQSRDFSGAGTAGLRFGQTEKTSSSPEEVATPVDRTKHISSDDYFGRNMITTDEQKEEVRRLHDEYDSATAISSDSYFGRPLSPEPAEMSQEYILSKAKDVAQSIASKAPDSVSNLLDSASNFDVQSVSSYLGRTAGTIWPGSGR
ncbi:uncharacterized protein V2V93DRAFT_373352 [Kockiozyma suomiensis]|uniref:uncharacterized protein n=1 Tax=Kockiozyma suomiensis TaxID=1337062 RepID=UPI0033438DD3